MDYNISLTHIDIFISEI